MLVKSVPSRSAPAPSAPSPGDSDGPSFGDYLRSEGRKGQKPAEARGRQARAHEREEAAHDAQEQAPPDEGPGRKDRPARAGRSPGQPRPTQSADAPAGEDRGPQQERARDQGRASARVPEAENRPPLPQPEAIQPSEAGPAGVAQTGATQQESGQPPAEPGSAQAGVEAAAVQVLLVQTQLQAQTQQPAGPGCAEGTSQVGGDAAAPDVRRPSAPAVAASLVSPPAAAADGLAAAPASARNSDSGGLPSVDGLAEPAAEAGGTGGTDTAGDPAAQRGMGAAASDGTGARATGSAAKADLGSPPNRATGARGVTGAGPNGATEGNGATGAGVTGASGALGFGPYGAPAAGANGAAFGHPISAAAGGHPATIATDGTPLEGRATLKVLEPRNFGPGDAASPSFLGASGAPNPAPATLAGPPSEPLNLAALSASLGGTVLLREPAEAACVETTAEIPEPVPANPPTLSRLAGAEGPSEPAPVPRVPATQVAQELHPRIIRALQEAVPAQRQVELSLTPARLGDLRIKLQLDADQSVRVHIQAQNVEVLPVLDAQGAELRTRLEESGLHLTDFRATSDGQSGQQRRQDPEPRKWSHSPTDSEPLIRRDPKRMYLRV